MFRKGMSCFCLAPRNYNVRILRRPLIWQKVGSISALPESLKSRRMYTTPGEINVLKHFHVSASLFSLNEHEIKHRMDNITDKFSEAMELLSDAVSSKGTVYFSEDMTDAEAQIEDVLKDYEQLLRLLSDDQARSVVRSIGLKMEELKAQLQLLKESVKE